jgi:hypothetical protein
MADREEQLLIDLLRDIAREDASLDAPHLESRVMEAFAEVRLKPDATSGTNVVSGFSGTITSAESSFLAGPENRTRPAFATVTILVAAAAILALVVAASLNRPGPQPVAPVARSTAAPSPPSQTEVVLPAANSPKPTTRAPKVVPAPAVSVPVNAEAVEPPAQVPEPAASESPAEFVPLLPLTAQDLTGTFQLVRVQMPRASLGPLRSPLERPDELVEADVLLGEDGRARAIRISAAGSIYPWRTR